MKRLLEDSERVSEETKSAVDEEKSEEGYVYWDRYGHEPADDSEYILFKLYVFELFYYYMQNILECTKI